MSLVPFLQVNTHRKRKHLLGNKSPNTSWLQLADFFFGKLTSCDQPWVAGKPSLVAPFMDREPTMDAMLLCLGGTIFLNQKLPPVSWAGGLKSAKLQANHCCVFCFCVFQKRLCFWRFSWFVFWAPIFFPHLGNGIQQGLEIINLN